jgi:hypothetical protein
MIIFLSSCASGPWADKLISSGLSCHYLAAIVYANRLAVKGCVSEDLFLPVKNVDVPLILKQNKHYFSWLMQK